jgi:uncharacterized protein (TIGR03067 family)
MNIDDLKFQNRRQRTLKMIALGAAILLMAAAPNGSNDLVKQETAKLEGRWLMDSTEYGGEKSAAERDKQLWHFVGNQVTRYVGPKKLDVLQLEIRPNEQPKHMDLIPVEGKAADDEAMFVARTKCLYSLEGGDLKIAFTFSFTPGTPAEEKQRAIEYAKTRPKTFDTKRGDVMVLTFKQEKAGNYSSLRGH